MAIRNPGEIPNNGIDDDKNGIVDDVHGADFTQQPATGVPLDGALSSATDRTL